jgi:hypothetical protein
LDNLISGEVKTLKEEEDPDMKAGGVLSKSVPRPRAEDSTQYMKSLTLE